MREREELAEKGLPSTSMRGQCNLIEITGRIMSYQPVAPSPQDLRELSASQIALLLCDLAIDRQNQVWCAEITYIPMPWAFAYLCAVMGWHSRKVLCWALSNTMKSGFCLDTLQKASTGFEHRIFNTDQGVQLTSEDWIQAPKIERSGYPTLIKQFPP